MDHTIGLIQKSQEGDARARELLVEENTGLVWCVARRFFHRGVEPDDLFQIGSIGLLKAIDKFDVSFDVKFSTYAVPLIAGEIKRFLRDDGMIKVSRLLKESAVKACRVREELLRKRGTEPTLEEIAKETGIPAEEIVIAMEAVSEVESLSQTVYGGDGSPALLEDRLPDRQDQNETMLNRLLLTQLLQMLSEEERELIRLRYFEDCTQVQVARRLGMTQVQVSRAEKRILKKLRQEGRGGL